jgi:hypothetical protein
MTKAEMKALRNSLICLLIVAAGIALSACTVVKTDSLLVLDFHPVGGQTDIDASKTSEGMTLKASRGQGSAEGIVRAATPNPLD